MLLNVYAKFKEDPTRFKLIGQDFMILEYQCPIEVDKMQVYLESNMLSYVISGKKDWTSEGKTYHVKQGDAIFLRKGVYTISQFFDVEHCVLVFFIHDDFIRNFMRENRIMTISPDDQYDPAFPIYVGEPLDNLFRSIFSYLKLGESVPRNLVELKFKELLFNLVLDRHHRNLLKYFSALSEPRLTSIDEVMSKNFNHDLQLEEFARLAGRSLSTFKREFKHIYRTTPGKWLADKRLKYACELLLSSQMNVNEVAYESGFRNSSHFNKSFKDKFKLTPKQFRSLHKKADQSSLLVETR